MGGSKEGAKNGNEHTGRPFMVARRRLIPGDTTNRLLSVVSKCRAGIPSNNWWVQLMGCKPDRLPFSGALAK